MVPGVEGLSRTVMVRLELLPAQFTACTLMLPVVNVELKFTVIEFVPCPEAIVALAGMVQL